MGGFIENIQYIVKDMPIQDQWTYTGAKYTELDQQIVMFYVSPSFQRLLVSVAKELERKPT